MAAETVPEQEAIRLCAIRKTADPARWAAGEKEGSMSCAFGVVCDPPRRGLVVEVRINRGHKVKRQTLNFGLWDTSTGGYVRIHQLTIADADSPTHNEGGEAWFGSHDHMGSRPTHRPDLNDESFDAALAIFLRTINLQLEEPLEDPLDPDKFTLK